MINSKSIFISHTHSDKDFVRKLHTDLRKHNLKAWLDEAEIKPGDSLIAKIEEGIDEMDYLAVVLSKKSVESEWVLREVRTALTQEISGRFVKVIPLLIEDCKLPGFLLDKLFIDFRDRSEKIYQEKLQTLINTLIDEDFTLPKSIRLIFLERLEDIPEDARAFGKYMSKDKTVQITKSLTDLQFTAIQKLRLRIDKSYAKPVRGIVESLALKTIEGNEWDAKEIFETLIKHGFLSLSTDPRERNHSDPGYVFTPLFFKYSNLMKYLEIGDLRHEKIGPLDSEYFLSSEKSPNSIT